MNRQAVQTLKTYFGYDTFREGQESVVESILEHRDVLAIMPTGAGKSICYQAVSYTHLDVYKRQPLCRQYGETDGMQGKDQKDIPSAAGTDKRGSGHEQAGVR